MTDITDLSTYKRRVERDAEIRQRMIRIGIALEKINNLMAVLKQMSKPDYKG